MYLLCYLQFEEQLIKTNGRTASLISVPTPLTVIAKRMQNLLKCILHWQQEDLIILVKQNAKINHGIYSFSPQI